MVLLEVRECNILKIILENDAFRQKYMELLKQNLNKYQFAAQLELLVTSFSDSFFISNKRFADEKYMKDLHLGDFSHKGISGIRFYDLKVGDKPDRLGELSKDSVSVFNGFYVCTNSILTELLIVSADTIREYLNSGIIDYFKEDDNSFGIRYKKSFKGYELVKDDPRVFYTTLHGIAINEA